MSLLTRPSVVFAIVFGCFAVLVPRIFLPLFRSKISPPSHNFDEHFRRSPPAVSRNEHGDSIEYIPGSPPHLRGAHPNMRMHQMNANNRQQTSSEHKSSKSIVTLALPMYTVGIGVFFIYTCCKYWSKKNSDETKLTKKEKNQFRWTNEKRKNIYEILDKDSAEEEENKEEFYSRLDPEYLEFLKSKKQKALEAERIMTEEQKQMHHALEDMKKSLSYISSKLVSKESRGNLNGNEIIQLQEHLASTESQMCKILTALDIATGKVNQIAQQDKTNENNHNQVECLSNSDEDSQQHHRSQSLSSNALSVNEENN